MTSFLRIAVLFFASASIDAYAWECGSNWNKEGNLNFEGVVVGIRTLYIGSEPCGREIQFRVIGASTSENSDTKTVRTGLFGASPGYPFLCSSQYLVFATKKDGHIVTDTCHKIEVLDDSLGYDELEDVVLVGNEGETKRNLYLQKLSSCHESNKSP